MKPHRAGKAEKTLLLACLVLAGCTASPVIAPARSVAPVDIEALRVAVRPGTSTITGVLLVHAGGRTRYGSLAKISLFADIPYVRECIRAEEHGTPLCGESLKPYTRFAIADIHGRFIFTGMGPGRYFLRSVISWDAPRGKLESIHMQRIAQADVMVDGEGESRAVRMLN
jgi:hypothetical protein